MNLKPILIFPVSLRIPAIVAAEAKELQPIHGGFFGGGNHRSDKCHFCSIAP